MDALHQKATRQHTKGHNSRLVLRTIYDADEISRADLARRTRLTRTTVSDVVGDLIEQGLVEEVGLGSNGIGRTPTLLSIAEDARHIAAVDITNTEIHCALVNLRGIVRRQITQDIAGQDGNMVLAQLCQSLDQLVRSAGMPLLGIGVSTPGLIDAASGSVRRAVSFGWKDLPLRDILHARYNLPIYVANDSHMVALAEYMFGQHQHSSELVVIKVGHGIGAGVVRNGQLLHGDMPGAGEIGHVVVVEDGPPCTCGNAGCLESVASTPAIVRQAQAAMHDHAESLLHRFAGTPEAVTLETVLQAFLADDPTTRQIIVDAGRYLSIAVANLIAILGIQRVVITGKIAPFGQILEDAIREQVGQRVLPDLAQATDIEVLSQRSDTVLLGAAALLLTNELGLARLLTRPPREQVLR
ncbi:MAG TPA: ROK family protein [Roseiflexaceae bacterium]|jgi:glucokinase-like ROK family protein|nr:ROK family protein [Roseiflexaceae bacterium]